MHALGSPNVYGADGACEVSRLTGWEHSLGYSPASDLAHTDCIMYLGRSIVDSSTMGAVDALNDARRRGAKIIVVDPRRSGSAALADRWLRVRPGCDLALLLGIAHVLIDEGLYDREFVDRYTMGFDELAQAAVLGRRVGRVDVRRAGRRDCRHGARSRCRRACRRGGCGLSWRHRNRVCQ